MFDAVPGVDDPRIMITVTVALKAPRKPLVLKVPRFDYITEDIYDLIDADIAAIDETLVPRKQTRLLQLALLKPLIPPKDYAVCEALPIGQLQAITTVWQEKSGIPLGEFVASADSSAGSTEAPSNMTSSPEDGSATTSDAA